MLDYLYVFSLMCNVFGFGAFYTKRWDVVGLAGSSLGLLAKRLQSRMPGSTQIPSVRPLVAWLVLRTKKQKVESCIFLSSPCLLRWLLFYSITVVVSWWCSIHLCLPPCFAPSAHFHPVQWQYVQIKSHLFVLDTVWYIHGQVLIGHGTAQWSNIIYSAHRERG